MPFWSRNKGTKQQNPAKYFQWAQKRLKRVEREMQVLEIFVTVPKPDMDKASKSASRLRELAEEQRNEVVPDAAMEDHKTGYFQIMDMQACKAEDIVNTGRANLEALLAEEEELEQQAADQAYGTQQRNQQLANRLGIQPPDFSDRKRR